MKYRTDLAVEIMEDIQKTGEITGVEMTKKQVDENIRIIDIEIIDETGARAMGKPIGRYVTMEIESVIDGSEDMKKKATEALAGELKKLIPFDYFLKVLIVGIGNHRVTPDSLGPNTLEKVKITRHIFKLYEADGDEDMACVSGFVPGVTGTTGLETAQLIKKAAEIAHPDIIIVVDSLAAKDVNRINTTIQFNDTGIAPGGGMGNLRESICKETMGTRVIAIGTPTVIDSKTIVMDAMKDHVAVEKIEEYLKNNEKQLVVTSTDIDLVIKDFSDIIANALNKALHPGI